MLDKASSTYLSEN